MNYPRVLTAMLVCFISVYTLEGQSNADSLKILLSHSSGNQRMTYLEAIARVKLLSDFNQSILYGDSLLKEATEARDDGMVATASQLLGEAHYYEGEPATAIEYFTAALAIYEKSGDKLNAGNMYNSLGVVYARQDSAKSMKYYRKALQLKTELNDSAGISSAMNNIGVLYEKAFRNLPLALHYYIKSYLMDLSRRDHEGIATSLLNIGDVKRQMGDYRAAIDSCEKCMEMSEKYGFGFLSELSSQSLYQSYSATGDYRKAFEYLKSFNDKQIKRYDQDSRKRVNDLEMQYKSKEQQKKIQTVQREKGIQRLIIYLLAFVVAFIVYFMIVLTGKNRKIKKANLAMLQRNEEIEKQRSILREQAEVLEKTNQELQKLSVVASRTDNSVVVANANGDIEWVNEGFGRMLGIDFEEFEKRYSSNFYKASLHPNIREAVDEAVRKREAITYSTYTVTRKGREIWIHTTLTPILDEDGKLQKIIAIDADVTRIKTAEQELTVKQQELTDSITYAHHIQLSMLPPVQLMAQWLKEHFVLYRPKDIVSGDFYWCMRKRNTTYLAIADCTGHGIPGAFMSILGITLLNEIISSLGEDDRNTDAAMILNTLRSNVKSALRQGSEHGDHGVTLDGMDIGFCILRDHERVIDYAGAYHSLFQITYAGGEPRLVSYEGNKMPLGVYPNDHLLFTNHRVSYTEKDTFYLFTDGYIHQWGGSSGKKFNRKRFRETLIGLAGKPLEEQYALLESTLNEWIQGSNIPGQKEFQVDDILVVGFRLG